VVAFRVGAIEKTIGVLNRALNKVVRGGRPSSGKPDLENGSPKE